MAHIKYTSTRDKIIKDIIMARGLGAFERLFEPFRVTKEEWKVMDYKKRCLAFSGAQLSFKITNKAFRRVGNIDYPTTIYYLYYKEED